MSRRTLDDPPPGYERHLVRNRSSRLAHGIQAIAVHSTESQDLHGTTDDLKGIRNWFNNPASQASSHLGIDGDGNTELWVPSTEKAWTILQLNSVTLNIEFIGRAAQPRSAWEETQLKEGAKWCAYWGKRFDIPMQRGAVRALAGEPVISKRGIIRHKDLTDAGFGTHVDPGPGFPMDRLLELCRYYRRWGYVA